MLSSFFKKIAGSSATTVDSTTTTTTTTVTTATTTTTATETTKPVAKKNVFLATFSGSYETPPGCDSSVTCPKITVTFPTAEKAAEFYKIFQQEIEQKRLPFEMEMLSCKDNTVSFHVRINQKDTHTMPLLVGSTLKNVAQTLAERFGLIYFPQEFINFLLEGCKTHAAKLKEWNMPTLDSVVSTTGTTNLSIEAKRGCHFAAIMNRLSLSIFSPEDLRLEFFDHEAIENLTIKYPAPQIQKLHSLASLFIVSLNYDQEKSTLTLSIQATPHCLQQHSNAAIKSFLQKIQEYFNQKTGQMPADIINETTVNIPIVCRQFSIAHATKNEAKYIDTIPGCSIMSTLKNVVYTMEEEENDWDFEFAPDFLDRLNAGYLAAIKKYDEYLKACGFKPLPEQCIYSDQFLTKKTQELINKNRDYLTYLSKHSRVFEFQNYDAVYNYVFQNLAALLDPPVQTAILSLLKIRNSLLQQLESCGNREKRFDINSKLLNICTVLNKIYNDHSLKNIYDLLVGSCEFCFKKDREIYPQLQKNIVLLKQAYPILTQMERQGASTQAINDADRPPAEMTTTRCTQ